MRRSRWCTVPRREMEWSQMTTGITRFIRLARILSRVLGGTDVISSVH